jgi:hypothetical protein
MAFKKFLLMISTLNKRDLSRYCDESTGINVPGTFEGDRLKVGEIKKSTAELKEGVVSIAATLNKHGRREMIK